MRLNLLRAISVLTWLFVGLNDVNHVHAHEVHTHEDISEKAALQSGLPKYLGSIDLKSLDDELTDINTRQSIARWIKSGAHDEDDTLSGNLARYRNHFFDPQNNGAGYSYGNISGEPSPDWGVEDAESFFTQQYSLRHARKYLYDALTLPNKDNREMYLARTFYTLGHVIHLIQDLSQPQHTRNDSHGGGPFGPYSRYEKWTDAHRDGLPFSDSNYNSGNPVVFNSARSFWFTGGGRGLAEFSSTNFLSYGTNFVNWNWGDPEAALSPADHPLPRWNGQKIPMDVQTLLADTLECRTNGYDPNCGYECGPAPELPPACGLTGEMVFYGTDVQDNYLGGPPQPNPRASTLSIFDQDLKSQGKKLFVLNRFNFEATYPFLIPKAVAYSAGLIDFFFRGRLEINEVSEVDGTLVIEVRNVSGTANPLKNGAFTLYYDATDGTRKPLSISQNAAIGELAHNALVTLTAAMPKYSDVDPSKENPLVLVYRGTIGQEEGVAAATMEVPLSGFIVRPSYVPADGVDGPRHIFFEDGGWKLNRRTNLVAGDIDWKGWYVNGKPTKVLSWRGNSIFYNGKLMAAAPRDVLGAALTRDSNGRAFVVAIVYDEATEEDVVFQRTAKRSDSTAIENAVSAPDGWRKTFSYARDRTHYRPQLPWFFNGAGTEAQTLRGVEMTVTDIDRHGSALTVKKGGLDRFKYTSQNGVGNINNLGNVDGYTQTLTIDVRPRYEDVGCGTEEYVGSALTATVIERGDYVVGVDYRDSEEMLVKLSKSQNTVLHQSSTWAYEVRKNPDGRCTATVFTTEMDSNATYTGGETLQSDGLAFMELVKRNNTVTDVCATGPNAVMLSGNSAVNAIWRSIEFLDPRDPLAFYFEDVEDFGVAYASSDGSINYQNTGSLVFRRMLKSAQALPSPQQVYAETLSLDGTNTVPLNFGGYCEVGVDWWWAGTVVHTFPGALIREQAGASGSWLVDYMGRVLVSLDKGTGLFGDRYGKPQGYYHFLTNAELLSVIPPAAGEPSPKYYPAGLIR